MKIIIINSRYFLSAGPEKYMFGLMKLLKSKGHEVIPFSTKNSKNKETEYEEYFADAIGGKEKVYYEEYKKDLKTSLQILDRQFYSRSVKKKLDALIKKTKPDIAYVLHHQNKLSPSVIDACRDNNVPVVIRLSDFALVCTRNNLLRDGSLCEECIHKSLFRGIRHKCVKDSFIGSLTKAAALYFYRVSGIYKKASRIIVPSKFTISKVKSLFDPGKIVYLPTFVISGQKPKNSPGDYALFVGRVEEEKGLIYAIKAFEGTTYKLKVVGKSHSGYGKYLKKYVEDNNIKNVEFLGGKYGKDLVKLYEKSRFVIIPTIWYENMPNVALEAMVHGKPIVTTDLGSMKEVVTDGDNGLLFRPKDIADLKNKITSLFGSDALCRKLGKNAYRHAVKMYNPGTHYNKLINIFEEVIQENKKK